jgi:hypothetical protein
VRVFRVAAVITVAGAAPLRVRQKEAAQTATQVIRHLLEVEHPAGPGWALHLQAVTVEVVVTFQGLNEQVIDREPHRAAPVGVAAEEAGCGLAGLVVHPIFLAVETEDVRLVLMNPRKGADAVGREELLLIEHVAQDALKLFARRDGQ